MSITTRLVNFGQQVRTSVANVVNALPRSRDELRNIHQAKVKAIKEAGVEQFAFDGLRTLVNIIDRGVAVAIQDQQDKADTRSWADEDLYRSFPFFRYMPDSLAREIARYLPPITFPIILKDEKNGFICYQLPIDAANKDKVEAARALVAQTLSDYGYVGWSDEIDRGYDSHSHYFVVENKAGEIVATSRVVHRTPTNNIAFENGFKPNGTQYNIGTGEGEVVDVNSFYNRRKNRLALYALFSAMGKYAWMVGAGRSFCLCDKNNRYISALYQRAGYRFSQRFKEAVYFPTFGKIKDEQFVPTIWSVMEMGPATIMFHSLRSLKFRFI